MATVIYGYNGYKLDDSIVRVMVPFKSKSCDILSNNQPRVVVLNMASF